MNSRRWTTANSTRQSYRRTPMLYGIQHIGDYMTVREVAGRLRITKQGVRARIRNGLLPALKVADMWYVKRADVRTSWRV